MHFSHIILSTAFTLVTLPSCSALPWTKSAAGVWIANNKNYRLDGTET